jgi:hypothetical protein
MFMPSPLDGDTQVREVVRVARFATATRQLPLAFVNSEMLNQKQKPSWN